MRLLRRFVLMWVVAMLGLPAGGAFAQTNFTSVVVFGDSLSDTGNIANLTQSQYKIRYPADNQALGFNYTDGRFTDGTDTQPAASTAYTGVWVEQLAGLLAAKVAVKDSLDGGTDYAYGDATTANGTTTETKTFLGQTLSITLNNMGQQVTTYLASNPAPNAQTLYVLWGGANDLLNAAGSGQDPVVAAQTAVGNELALVQRLRAAGATNFMLPNLPPLGATPTAAGTPGATALNNASLAYAQALTAGLNGLKQGAMGATLNLFQPDVFTLFQTVAAQPMAFGLSNVSKAAQGVAGSPDTYLIWDGLHPTTTGHHLAAAAAANLLAPLAASSTALTVPAAGLAGQPVTVSAVVSPAKSGGSVTGLVAFFGGTTLVGSAPLDANRTAQVTFTPAGAAGSDVALTAVYAGDVGNAPSTSAAATFALLSAAVSTTTALTSSNPNANVGASVTFTATVAATVASYGTPAGTVTFSDGSSSLGTGTLNNGVATFATSSLAPGTHSITANYAASGIFGGSTSAALSEVVVAPGFTAQASPTSLTLASGNSGTVNITAASVGGYSGTLTLSCGALPAHFSCAFSSPTLSLTAGTTGNVADTLTIATNAGTTTARLDRQAPAWQAARIWSASLLFPGAASVAFLGLRRRRKGLRGLMLPIVLAVLAGAGSLGMTGCGSSNNAPAGTYTVPVVFTPSGTGSSAPAALTVNVAVTVQ